MITKDFKKDFLFFKELLLSKKNFALPRYADGEYAVIQNHKITGIDGWSITSNDTQLSYEMKQTLSHTESNYYYGISCPCCDLPTHMALYGLLQPNKDRITFSNIFVNANWKGAFDLFMSLDKTLICSEKTTLPQDKYIPISSNVIVDYRLNRLKLLEKFKSIAVNNSNKLFCIAAGPLSEIIIHWMYSENPDNQYVDIGSCLDPYIHGNPTRSYQLSSEFSNRVCIL